MTNPLHPFRIIEHLSEKARQEESPTVDVSLQVLKRLRETPPIAAEDNSFLWFAIGSASLATLSIFISLSLWNDLTDPLVILFQTIPTFLI